MLFSVFDEFVEAAACFFLFSQFAPGQSLVENFVRLLVVIEKGYGRFGRTLGCFFKILPGQRCFLKALVCTSHPIVNVVLFGHRKLAFAQIFRIFLCFFQQAHGIGIPLFL